MPRVSTYRKSWLSSALRELREERGWSRQDFADVVAEGAGEHGKASAVSAEYVRKLERGARQPSIKALEQMLTAFGLTRSQLEARFDPQPAPKAALAATSLAGHPKLEAESAWLDTPRGAGTWSADVGGPSAHALYAALPSPVTKGMRGTMAPRSHRMATVSPRALGHSTDDTEALASARAPGRSADDSEHRELAELLSEWGRLTKQSRTQLLEYARQLPRSASD